MEIKNSCFLSREEKQKKNQSILVSITITFAKSVEEKKRFHQRNYIDLFIFLAVGRGRRGKFIVGDGAFFSSFLLSLSLHYYYSDLVEKHFFQNRRTATLSSDSIRLLVHSPNWTMKIKYFSF